MSTASLFIKNNLEVRIFTNLSTSKTFWWKNNNYVTNRNSRLVWLVRNSLKFEIGDWVFVSSSYLARKSKTSWWCLISFYISKLEFKEFWSTNTFTGFLFCNAFQHIKKTVDSRIWFWFNYVAWQKRKKCKMSPVSPLT